MPYLEYYTPKEIAKKLRVNYRTILNEINKGNLCAIKIGKTNIVPYEEFEAYLAGKTSIKPQEVSVAIVLKENKVLLVQRKAKEGRLKWQFPAGILKYAEKARTRAEIVCLQETGVHCAAKKKFGKRVHPDTRVIVHYWLCEYIGGKAYNVDNAENKKVEWVDRNEVKNKFTSDFFKPVQDFLES